MLYQILECSPKAAAKIVSHEDKVGVSEPSKHHRSRYPWGELQIGFSFAVPFAEANEASLRNGAVQASKKLGKSFTVIRHNDGGVFEVARIA